MANARCALLRGRTRRSARVQDPPSGECCSAPLTPSVGKDSFERYVRSADDRFVDINNKCGE